jgi:Domain of unknown function (DUF4270)
MRFFKTAFLFLFFTTLFSCERPEDGIGLNVQPEEDLLNLVTTDTSSIKAYTAKDTVRTDEVFNGMVGAYFDPVFGLVNAAMVAELALSSTELNFVRDTFSAIIIDSVVLSLSYSGDTAFYGTVGEQKFRINELQENLFLDSAYYNIDYPSPFSANLVDESVSSVTPNPYDSVYVNNNDSLNTQTKLDAQIRIRLNNSVGQKIIDKAREAPLLNSDFRTFFKGLYIGVEPSNSTMINLIDWNSNASRMTIYYREPNDSEVEFKKEDFYIKTLVPRYNFITHFFANASPDLEDQVENPMNISLGQQNLYLQAGGGTKIILKLPELDQYASVPNLSVNKAELIIPVKSFSDDLYAIPDRLGALALDGNGEVVLLPDQLEGGDFIDGNYDEEISAYRINISRFVQQVLYGNFKNYGLQIVTTNSAITPNRVQINGPDNIMENNTKLVLYFTKY